MYQNTCVGFKLGYVDAKSNAIAFYVKTYPSDSFIKNRTNMHKMQNRMKITFCVKPPLPSILLAVFGVFGGFRGFRAFGGFRSEVFVVFGGFSWPSAGSFRGGAQLA